MAWLKLLWTEDIGLKVDVTDTALSPRCWTRADVWPVRPKAIPRAHA